MTGRTSAIIERLDETSFTKKQTFMSDGKISHFFGPGFANAQGGFIGQLDYRRGCSLDVLYMWWCLRDGLHCVVVWLWGVDLPTAWLTQEKMFGLSIFGRLPRISTRFEGR